VASYLFCGPLFCSTGLHICFVPVPCCFIALIALSKQRKRGKSAVCWGQSNTTPKTGRDRAEAGREEATQQCPQWMCSQTRCRDAWKGTVTKKHHEGEQCH
jgi:hypothetical protein